MSEAATRAGVNPAGRVGSSWSGIRHNPDRRFTGPTTTTSPPSAAPTMILAPTQIGPPNCRELALRRLRRVNEAVDFRTSTTAPNIDLQVAQFEQLQTRVRRAARGRIVGDRGPGAQFTSERPGPDRSLRSYPLEATMRSISSPAQSAVDPAFAWPFLQASMVGQSTGILSPRACASRRARRDSNPQPSDP